MLVADSAMPSGERVKLLDFGVAKLAIALHAADSQVRTHAGQTLGTPQYMSPEQCRDVSQVDGMTDVYALGVILYQMLSGQVPFISSGEFAIAAMHLYEPPPPLQSRAPQVTELTAELVHRMLAKNKEERPTMAQVLTVLQTMGINVTASTQKASAISLGGQSGSISMADIQAAERLGTLGELSGTSGRSIPAALLSAAIPVVPANNPTTLGTSTGQLTHRSSRLFWGVTAAAGASVLAVTLLASGLLSDNKTATTAPVRWQVSTRPPGATVLRSDNGTILGKTPWHYEQPASAGKLQVSIQYTGYQTNTLTLDSGRDETLELTLVPIPAPKVEPPPPPPPKHKSRSHKAKPDEEGDPKEELP
jgi:serine/threonine-protein kinase